MTTRGPGTTEGSGGDPAPEYALKPEHAAVREALRVAVVAYERPVIVAEVIQALGSAARQELASTYANDFATAVSKVVQQLVNRQIALTVGRLGKHRYYALPGMLPADRLCLPAAKSRRQRVLAILTDVVQERRTPVLASDVVDAAAAHAYGGGLTRTFIIRDMQNLVRTGDVKIVGTVRGGNDSNLYCPTALQDLIADGSAARSPLTWLEAVQRTFETLWAEEADLARVQNRRPFALTTGAVRARLQLTHAGHERLADPRVLINSLNQLASTANPTIRVLDTVGETGSLRWVPAAVMDAEVDVDGVYATDVERLIAAVRRAAAQRPRGRDDAPPPVPAVEVAAVVASDPALRLRADGHVADALSDACKEMLDSGDGNRADRVAQHIWRVGRIDGRAYYAVSHVEEARAYVLLRNLEFEWSACHAEDRFARLNHECPLPATARGRALLLQGELSAMRWTAQRLDGIDVEDAEEGTEAGTYRDDLRADASTRAGARALGEEIGALQWRINEWLAAQCGVDGAPSTVDTRAPGWTADEFHKVTRAMHPRGEIAKTRAEIIRLFPLIRRVSNPEHEHRSREAARAAAECLFDRADALLHAAARWGGPMAVMRAAHARALLDRLRDPRFVLADLDRWWQPGVRIGAASCLAFLDPTPDNTGALRGVAVKDTNPGVRQTALWALGFSAYVIGDQLAAAFIRERADADGDRRVRDWANHALSVASGVKGWWMV